MVAEIGWYNIGLVGGIIALLIYQVKRFRDSNKPEKGGTTSFAFKGIFAERDEEYHTKRFHKQSRVYWIIHVAPLFLSLLSLIVIFNLYIGVSLLILAIISTVVTEVAIKIWNI